MGDPVLDATSTFATTPVRTCTYNRKKPRPERRFWRAASGYSGRGIQVVSSRSWKLLKSPRKIEVGFSGLRSAPNVAPPTSRSKTITNSERIAPNETQDQLPLAERERGCRLKVEVIKS